MVRYKGSQSGPFPHPSGGPQGDPIGMIAFLIVVSDCGTELPLPPPEDNQLDVNCVPFPPPPAETKDEI